MHHVSEFSRFVSAMLTAACQWLPLACKNSWHVTTIAVALLPGLTDETEGMLRGRQPVVEAQTPGGNLHQRGLVTTCRQLAIIAAPAPSPAGWRDSPSVACQRVGPG